MGFLQESVWKLNPALPPLFQEPCARKGCKSSKSVLSYAVYSERGAFF